MLGVRRRRRTTIPSIRISYIIVVNISTSAMTSLALNMTLPTMNRGGSSTTGRRSYCQREVDAGCDEVGLGFDIASRCQDGASQLGRREGDRVEKELGDVVRAQMQQLVVRIGLRHLEGLVGASLAVEV